MLRAVLYFAIWTALAVWAARAYGNDAAMTRAASAGLIVWALTSSWAGIDWLESVEPHFHSSIYGLFAIGFAAAGRPWPSASWRVLTLKRLAPDEQRVLWRRAARGAAAVGLSARDAVHHHLGRQYSGRGGLVSDAARRRLGLSRCGRCIIGQFVVPFFALLSERVRASTPALLWLAGATLALRFLEAAVLILPPLACRSLALLLDLPAALLAIGASWLLAWRLRRPLWQRWSGRAAAAR